MLRDLDRSGYTNVGDIKKTRTRPIIVSDFTLVDHVKSTMLGGFFFLISPPYTPFTFNFYIKTGLRDHIKAHQKKENSLLCGSLRQF